MLADAARILFALGLPFLTGALLVLSMGRVGRPGYPFLVCGLALPLGLVMIMVGYVLLDFLGIGLFFRFNLAFQLVLLVPLSLLLAAGAGRSTTIITITSSADSLADLSRSARWLVMLIVAWLLVRWVGIFLEVVSRPLFPWDAWRGYATEAKIWFFDPKADVAFQDSSFFQNEATYSGGTKHPSGVAYVQLWFLQALGRFDDALMNVAWPLAMASIGLVVFGSLRALAVRLSISVGATVLVSTLPMLNTQAALAGYGDIWIAVLMLVAFSGILFSREFGLKWLVVVIIAVSGMLLLKQTSWLWLPFLVLASSAGWVKGRWLALIGVVGLVGLLGLLLLLDGIVTFPYVGRFGITDSGLLLVRALGFSNFSDFEVMSNLVRHLFVYRNWHLFWYIMPFIAIISIWLSRSDRSILMGSLLTWGGFAALMTFFLFSSLGEGVTDGTRVNRLVLHLVPVMSLLAGLSVSRLEKAFTGRPST